MEKDLRKARLISYRLSRSTGIEREEIYAECLLIISYCISKNKKINYKYLNFRVIDALRTGKFNERSFKRSKLFDDWRKSEKEENDFFVKNGYYREKSKTINPLKYIDIQSDMFHDDDTRSIDSDISIKPIERNIFIKNKYFDYLDKTSQPAYLEQKKQAFNLYMNGTEIKDIVNLVKTRDNKWNGYKDAEYQFFTHMVKAPFKKFLKIHNLNPKDFF